MVTRLHGTSQSLCDNMYMNLYSSTAHVCGCKELEHDPDPVKVSPITQPLVCDNYTQHFTVVPARSDSTSKRATEPFRVGSLSLIHRL